ncbi:MAG: hypothetical protein HZA72_02870, partial [Candidatus Omnitrophica bacterium]|nr:hypothetical protein [Candidatus Omnitrophota bacterium]
MRNTIMKKILCSVVAFLFLFNNIAYGMSPIVASSDLGEGSSTRDGMYALGQKWFAIKRGPGAIDFDAVKPFPFRGRAPMVEWADFNVKTDYNNPPAGWDKNKLLEIRDLKKAFEYFRDYEAQIPAELLLDIEVGRFDVDLAKGELPITCIEKRKGRYALVIHEDFARMWNDIRNNDVWFNYTFPDGKTRTLSVAWGIFFRIAKHEMGDLDKLGLYPKSEGHINFYPFPVAGREGTYKVLGKDKELIANAIGGRYNIANDAIWAWFLGSYCFTNLTRYDNNILEERLNWFFEGKDAQEMNLNLEFPNLLPDRKVREHAKKLTLGINYRYFAKGAEAVKIREEELASQEKNMNRFASILAEHFVTEGVDLSNTSDCGRIKSEAGYRLRYYIDKAVAYMILYRSGYPLPRYLDSVSIESDRHEAARSSQPISYALDGRLRYLAIDAAREVFNDL